MKRARLTGKDDPPLRGTSRRMMIFALIFVVHLVALRAAHLFPYHRVLYIFFFFTLVLVPGNIIFRAFSPPTSFLFRILFSFLTGIAVFYSFLIVFAIFRWDIKWIGLLIPLAGFLVLVIKRPAAAETDHLSVGKPVLKTETPALMILLIAIILTAVAALILYYEDPIFYTSDSQDGIAYIRAVSRTHEAFPSEFLYSDGGKLTSDIRKGLVHGMWGTINLLTGRTDTLPIWSLISIIGAVFVLLSFYCSSLILFRSQAAGLLSILFFILFYHGGLTGHQMITVAYGFPFGKIFSVVFLAMLLLYLRTGNRFHLGLLAIASFCGTGTHIGHFIIAGFLVSVFAVSLLFYKSLKNRFRLLSFNIFAAAAAVIAINIPYLLLRYIRDYAPANILHTHPQGFLYLTEHLSVLNPVVFYQSAGPLFIISIAAIFILWKRSAEDLSLRLLLSGVIANLVLVFNPIWLPFLMSKISYLLIRMEFSIPSPMIASVLAVSLWKRTKGEKNGISGKGMVAGWIIIAILGSALIKLPTGFAYKKIPDESARDLDDMYQALNRLIPPGSVIASDPVTSYSIPAFTDQFVICTLDQHSVPNDSTALERILDCREIFQLAKSPGEISDLMRKYRSEYLVVNGRIPDSVHPLYWKPGIRCFHRTESLLSGSPGFDRLYSNRSLSIYRLGSHISKTEPAVAEKTRWPELAADESGSLKQSGEEGIYIRDISFGEKTAARGDTLEMSIRWVAVSSCEPAGYHAYVRFNTSFEKGYLFDESYGKIYRKLMEIKNDERYRFRFGFIPFNGLFPPDRWPVGRIVTERISIPVPNDIKAGEYSVAVRLTRTTQYANYTITDLFTDDDFYQGEKIGSVVIE